LDITLGVLDLLEHLFDEHKRGADYGRIRVIPVLIDTLELHGRLIEAAFLHAGGQFIDSHSLEHGTGFISSVESDLRPKMEAVLCVPQPVGRGYQRIKITVKKGIPSAKLNGRSINEITSQGDRDVLGIVHALLDQRLRQTALAAVAYRDVNLDELWAEAIWKLFTQVIHGQAMGSLRTLALLVESGNAYASRHFQPGETGVSVKMRLSASGLDSRGDWSTSRSEVHRLRPDPGQVLVLFLGAGFSISSGLGLGNQYRDRALRNLLKAGPEQSAADLASSFFRWLVDKNRLLKSEKGQSEQAFVRDLTLERVLREEYHLIGGHQTSPTLTHIEEGNAKALKSPGNAVTALRRIIGKSDRSLVLVTVNFDTLIEDGSDVRVFASDGEFAECSAYLDHYLVHGGSVPLLKLHGTIDRRETVVITSDAVESGLGIPKGDTLQRLAEVASSRTKQHGAPALKWVYIGCSMRDKDINPIISAPSFSRLLKETWVSPFPVHTVSQFIQQNRLAEYGQNGVEERCITEPADTFLEELDRAW
jgi:hypothetical protein